ncbi:MAG: ABC transporter ATP-binding protein/permease [Anaerolineales bacterium]|nr:ABC transporter ATP-binding protein/permease [Anaerolineales bacterium]
MLLVNAANLATPQILRYLIDRGITPLNMTWVWYAVLGLFAVAVVRGVFNFLQGYWSEVSAQGVAFDLRNVIFAKLEHLSFSYHDSAQTGKLMTRMTSDVELVQMFVGRGSLMIVSALILLAGTVVVMLNMNWKLTLVLLAIIPILFGIFAFFVRGITPISKEVQVKLSNLNTTLQENLAGARVVKAFAREAYELERFIQQNQELLNANLNMVRLFTSFFPLIFFVGNLATVGVVWFGGLQAIGESLSLGELVAFLGYVNFLLMPIFMIGMIGSMLGRAEASAQRIFEVIDTQSDVQNRADAILLPPIKGRVAFNDVSFRYFDSGENVLCNVSFTAEPGQVIAIMGKTGAGKSSIINLIPRFYDVTSGRVTIDSYDVREVTLDSLRSQVGIVLQETTLFSGTIRDNIAYGRPEATLEEVMAAAKAAQAHEFIMEMPDGYDTGVGERGVGLSGGQKQRVAIARTLLVDPRILILDDSTSSVDAETEYKIQQALQQLMIGRTSFIIAQRISTVRNANLILLLDNGDLVAQGSHDELRRTSELYVEILETQFGEHAELLAVVEEELVI